MKPVTLRRNGADAEGRFARRVTSLLDEAGGELDGTISERLRFARERALARAVELRRLSPETVRVQAAAASGVGGGTIALGGGFGLPDSDRSERWFRLSAIVPVLLLVVGLLAIQEWHQRSQITAAAEVDLDLLGDDLPPDAYADPGFLEFLKLPADPAPPAVEAGESSAPAAEDTTADPGADTAGQGTVEGAGEAGSAAEAAPAAAPAGSDTAQPPSR